MKYIFYLILAIILYFIFVYGRAVLVLRDAKNPHIEHKDAEYGNGSSTIRYIAAGDSTVVGVGASSVEKTYPYKVAEFLGKNHKVIYKNIGVSGARINDVIEKQLPEIIAFDPDVVTISIGGNDIDRLATEEEIMSGFKKIIEELTTKTNAKIYMANLPNFTGARLLPTPYITLIEKRSAPINRAIAQLETDRVKIADVHGRFGSHEDVDAVYSSDWFHPSDEGYEYWVTAFTEKMN